jgi:hypothetical protein
MYFIKRKAFFMGKSRDYSSVLEPVKSELAKVEHVKVDKVEFPAYKTAPFMSERPGAAEILQENLNQMSSFGFDFVGLVPGKSENILIFRFRK